VTHSPPETVNLAQVQQPVSCTMSPGLRQGAPRPPQPATATVHDMIQHGAATSALRQPTTLEGKLLYNLGTATHQQTSCRRNCVGHGCATRRINQATRRYRIRQPHLKALCNPGRKLTQHNRRHNHTHTYNQSRCTYAICIGNTTESPSLLADMQGDMTELQRVKTQRHKLLYSLEYALVQQRIRQLDATASRKQTHQPENQTQTQQAIGRIRQPYSMGHTISAGTARHAMPIINLSHQDGSTPHTIPHMHCSHGMAARKRPEQTRCHADCSKRQHDHNHKPDTHIHTTCVRGAQRTRQTVTSQQHHIPKTQHLYYLIQPITQSMAWAAQT
jgi:hypothetical protein